MLHGFLSDTNVHTVQASYSEIAAAYRGKPTEVFSCTVWQNDTKTARMVVFSDETAPGTLVARAGDFVSEDGDRLRNASIEPHFITDTMAHDDGTMIPDIIWEDNRTALGASALCSLWVYFRTTDDTAPGIYRGSITVRATEAGEEIAFPCRVEVLPLKRPEARDAGVQLELWQYPYSIDRYYSGLSAKDYFGEGVTALHGVHLSDRFASHRRAELEYYAAAGGRAITVTCVEDPWNSQTPDPYPSMVKWHEDKDGAFTFDYTDLDAWVQMNLDCGIDGQIKTFSIACWGNRVTYYSEKTGAVESKPLTPGTEEWREIWRQFLESYMKHMKERGWFEITYISMDEREYEEVRHLLDLVESVRDEEGRCFKSSLCVFLWDTEPLFDRVADLSLGFGMEEERVKALSAHRREMGCLTTLYTCGAACSALKCTPADGLYSILRTAQRGTDGFLRWAINAYNESPLTTSYNVNFAPGDVFMIYPMDADSTVGGVRSSVRFEKIIEGVRTVTKLRALQGMSAQVCEQANAILETLDCVEGEDSVTMVTRITDALDALARTVC